MRKAEKNGWRIKEKNALARIGKKKIFCESVNNFGAGNTG